MSVMRLVRCCRTYSRFPLGKAGREIISSSVKNCSAAKLLKKEQKAYVTLSKVTDEQLKKHVTDMNKATKFIGMKVKNLQNENLGEVQELVFDLETGRIAYAVLSVGGFLGANEKNIAVPITALTAETAVVNHEKHERHEMRRNCQDHGVHLPSEAASLLKPLFFRVFRVFRGLNRG
ncbi:MAG: PRC-barrel domain containing protein [Verrucomicrobia bacterium]|nr:PRC-barrel domain containing protein [Verrucomicrobiota bacterium]